jgi:hypothetical protein
MRSSMMRVFRTSAAAAAVALSTASVAASPAMLERDTDFASQIEQNAQMTAGRSLRGQPEGFEQLTRLADEYRHGAHRLPSGMWYLSYFYSSLDGIFNVPPREALFKQWKDAHPASPAPYIVDAMHSISRGFGPGMRALSERHFAVSTADNPTALQQAKAVLLESRLVSSVDPHWYALMAQIAVGGAMEEDEFITLMQEGLRRFPEYDFLYAASADYYLPKWNGDSESLESWAQNVRKIVGGNAGDRAYVLIYRHAHRIEYGDRLHMAIHADRTLMKISLRDMIERSKSSEIANWAALSACLAGDRDETRRLFERIGSYTELHTWETRDRLLTCRAWAGVR